MRIISLTMLLLSVCSIMSYGQQLIISSGHSWTDAELYQSSKPGDEQKANTNYSSSIRNHAYGWTVSGYPAKRRSLIKFDLSQISPGTKIKSAYLQFFSDPTVSSSSAWNGNSQLSGSNAFYLEKVTQAWNEKAVTWNNQPASTISGRVWIGPSASTTENIQVLVTALVQGMINNPAANHGLKMILENEAYYRSRAYASENHSNTAIHPKLVINFERPLSIKEESDFTLAPLDKSKIPSKILYDRVFGMADLENFHGKTGTDTTEAAHFYQAYYELINANYNTSAMLDYNAMRQKIDNTFNQNSSIALGIINYNFHSLDPESLSKNLITVSNGQAYDVPGRTLSPYLAKRTLIAAPLLPFDNIAVYTGNTSFKLDTQFFYTNSGTTLQYCDINFGDGQGPRRVSPNSTVNINYTTAGEKLIRFSVKLSNGELLQAYSFLSVTTPPTAVATAFSTANSGRCNTIVEVPVTGYDFNVNQYENPGSSTIKNERAKVTAHIYFADKNCSDKKVRKPIVFLDGIDPMNTRDRDEIYENYINDFNNDKVNINLGEKFRAEDYDLIIVDYEDGGDYIEKNGLAVIKVLESLYTTYGQNFEQDFVVIGPSMGALVGQYALAEAERRGKNLHTRLYISFDGPHQGANIPIGIQQAAGYVFKSEIVAPSRNCQTREYNEGIEEESFASNVPAAKQLLLHHYLTLSENPKAHPYRDIFVANMNRAGYPKNCRNIAIVNGSIKALNQSSISATGEILKARLLLNVGARKGFDLINWRFYASPQSGRSKTFDAFTFMPIAILKGLEENYIEYGRPATGNYSLDILPGGYSPTMEEIVNANFTSVPVGCVPITYIPPVYGTGMGDFVRVPFKTFKKGKNIKITSASPNHSFIPTTSAVDLRHSSGHKFVYNFSTENIVCNGLTPFDAVYVPNGNQKHVAINSENAVWFENEIKGIPRLPVLDSKASITGSSTICGEQVYEVINFPIGSTFSWDKSPDLKIVSGQWTKAIKVSPTSTTGNASWIEVTVTDKCGGKYKPVRLAIVKGSSLIPITGTYKTNDGTFNLAFTGIEVPFGTTTVTVSAPGVSSFTWRLVEGNPSSWRSYNSGRNLEVIFYGSQYQSGSFEVSASNSCGSVKKTVTFYKTPSGSTMYAIYPNPASNELSIDLIQLSEGDTGNITANKIYPTDKQEDEFDISLFDMNGTLLKMEKSKKGKLLLGVGDLENNIYILNIQKGKEISTHQIMIQK